MPRKPRTLAAVHDTNLYQVIGGTATCRSLSSAFYARVQRDPLLRPLFPGKTLKCAIEEFAAFLVQFLGGPREDTQRRWWLSLRESHLRFKIGQKERAAWMNNMARALDDVPIAEPVRNALLGFFERSSAYVVNQGQVPRTGTNRSEPPGDRIGQEIELRWDAQRKLDETVAAVRSGDAERAIMLAESPALRTLGCAVATGLLTLMLKSGHKTMLDYVRAKLTSDPALVRERYAGRTLLHDASGQANLSMVKLLLRLGADPNTSGGHGPLYCLANECRVSGGGGVVRALVQAGAHVDADECVKRCTALHMAARRGNVEVAEALLDCGAAIEARDSLGDTPLRRAVNCNKVEVAALLLSRGADRDSRGSKGLTPLQAARTSEMKRLLREKEAP
jgi:truncated hemoglobin YjbI/ankyrin repeat protein